MGNWQVKNLKKTRIKEINKLSKVWCVHMMEDCRAINVLWIVILTWKYMLSELVSVRDHQTTRIIRYILNMCVGKWILCILCIAIVQLLSLCNSSRSYGLEHARLPCPSLSPRVCSNSCPLSQWCHPAISSSVAHFSSCPQPFPASGSFLRSQHFSSGDQSIGASASASVLDSSLCFIQPGILHAVLCI